MGLSEKLTEAKSEIDSLIAYANGVTGESDASIGDAILTLCSGFGSGGSLVKEFESCVEATIETDHTTSSYEYLTLNLISTDYLYITNSEDVTVWIFEVYNEDKSIVYTTVMLTSSGAVSTKAILNRVNGVTSYTPIISPEYRNQYGALFRVQINRNTQVYAGNYTINTVAFKLKNVIS